MFEDIQNELKDATRCLEEFSNNQDNLHLIQNAAQVFTQAIDSGHKIISCGNGGSMSDAMHFAEELTGRYRDSRKSLSAIAISDPGFISCAANDFGYEHVFERFIEGMGKSGDVLLAISTSGNSENILLAAKKAKELNIKVIALTGKDGGKLAALADVEIRAPHSDYADRVQEIHIKVIHIFIHLIEKSLGLNG
jgi:D-sedoheptulose 7-phosphate isomerase|tara:strand:+ start:1482 stop:2063 length:582 start_codon:yes stop_codon:yes gene_type:complete